MIKMRCIYIIKMRCIYMIKMRCMYIYIYIYVYSEWRCTWMLARPRSDEDEMYIFVYNAQICV